MTCAGDERDLGRQRPRPPWRWAPVLAIAALALALPACGHRVVRPMPLSNAPIGQCADPGQGGVIGRHPRLVRGDRDLNGDREAEVVVADRSLCTDDGNCYWNVYDRDRTAGCERLVGTIEGAFIDRLESRGEEGFHDLRAWWRLTDESRYLLQLYRFQRGGYRMVEVQVCRQADGDLLQCSTDGR